MKITKSCITGYQGGRFYSCPGHLNRYAARDYARRKGWERLDIIREVFTV